MSFPKTNALVVMGVSGCGKTTVGRALADALGWNFYDADDFHPSENIKKMQAGTPLDDNDRLPWLLRLSELIDSEHKNGLVLACSALKQKYRKLLITNTNATFIYLEGTRELIAERMLTREHFMPATLLESQFATLEPPEDAIRVSINQSVARIVNEILKQLEY